jgi:hypothetical protein
MQFRYEYGVAILAFIGMPFLTIDLDSGRKRCSREDSGEKESQSLVVVSG